MTLFPQAIGPIPEATLRVAKQINRKGTLAMRLRDEFATMYTDADFVDLFPVRGQPAFSPWRLTLVTLLQFVDGLTDRQAAEAVQQRIDWKYALGLELTDPGFDFSILSEFRGRLLTHQATQRLLEKQLQVCLDRGWITPKGNVRIDSTHVVANVRQLHQIETVLESVHLALEELVDHAPEWLESWMPLDWERTYGPYSLSRRLPKSKTQREAFAKQMGQDIEWLWKQLAHAPKGMDQLPKVRLLRTIWQQNYEQKGGVSHWRDGPKKKGSWASMIVSPNDPDARISRKGDTKWVGYKGHLVESCEPGQAHLVLHVETTNATVPDQDMLVFLHQRLIEKGFHPEKSFVDSGYVTLNTLVTSDEQQIHVVGPMGINHSWQSQQEQGYGAEHFVVDWQARQAQCPQGKTSVGWSDRKEDQSVLIRFSQTDCRQCPMHAACTRAKARVLTLPNQERFERMQQQREISKEEEFKRAYRTRAGVEGTIGQAVHLGFRVSRYRRQPKVEQQHIFVAVALNMMRMDRFGRGVARAQTRQSRVTRLRQAKGA